MIKQMTPKLTEFSKFARREIFTNQEYENELDSE